MAKNAKQPKRLQKDILAKKDTDAEIMRKKQEKANLKKQQQNGNGGNDKNKKKKKSPYAQKDKKPKSDRNALKNKKKKMHNKKWWGLRVPLQQLPRPLLYTAFLYCRIGNRSAFYCV